MEWIIANYDSLILIGTSAVTLASLIVKLTPTKKDDEAMGKLMRFINLIAMSKKK
jgi:hypothetical protein